MTNAEIWLALILASCAVTLLTLALNAIRKNHHEIKLSQPKEPPRILICNCPIECDRVELENQIQSVLGRWLIYTDLGQKVILPVEYRDKDEPVEKMHPGMIVVIVQVDITDSALALYVDGGIRLGIDKLNKDNKFGRQIIIYRVQQ